MVPVAGFGHVMFCCSQCPCLDAFALPRALSCRSGCDSVPRLFPSPLALSAQSQVFQKNSRTLRRQFWWQNMKMKLIVISAVVLCLVVVFLLICFSKIDCFNRKG